MVTANQLIREYNSNLDDAKRKVDLHNIETQQALINIGATHSVIQRCLLPVPKEVPLMKGRSARNFLKLFSYTKRALNTSGNFLEWGDPRLRASHLRLHEHISNGVHRFLILNIDQVWRANLRLQKGVYMKKASLRVPKEKGGLIARHDHFAGSRLSITAVTSSWSDGTAGPLGLCYPRGMIKAKQVEEFNLRNKGRALLFCSEKKSHFMDGESFIIMMREMLSDGFSLQRRRHKLSSETEGLILADGWTGYHSWSSGLNVSREAWAQANHVRLPDLQVGGWSASCQPVDQIHHILRCKLDATDAADAGCEANLFKRAKYDQMAVKPNGQVARSVNTASLPERTLKAWESMLGPQRETGLGLGWCPQTKPSFCKPA